MATSYPQTQTASRSFSVRRMITLEQGLYLVIGVLAVLLHLYALGSRALHHDETLHAQYSWRVFQGDGYQHDPLLHGPFLYYITAAGYLLFGATDTTARITAALFGIILTMLPLLLRRELGRGAALLASAYLLISPVALYVGRFIRHDIYGVVFEVLSVIALARYIRTERARWHYLLAAVSSLMLVNMESFYLFILMIGSFVGLWLLWQISQRSLLLIGGYLAVVGAAVKGLPRLLDRPLPIVSEGDALNVRHQPNNDWGEYFSKVNGVLKPFFVHPSIQVVFAATLLLAAGVIYMVWLRRDAQGRNAWQRAGASAEPGTLLYAVQRIPKRQWGIAWLIAFVIYAVFYTGLLSNVVRPNITALVTGVSGSFLYWMGQHSVRRGGQPAHFYLFEIGLYDPLILLGFVIGIVMVVRRLLIVRRSANALLAADQPADQSLHPSWVSSARTHELLFMPALLAWWSVTALAIYSWAGEKMPWLTIHMTVPLALLSAWAFARLAAWAFRDGFDKRIVGLLIAVLSFGLLCVIRLNIVSSGEAQAEVLLRTAWVWPLAFLALTGLAVATAGVLQSKRTAVALTLALLVCTLLPYTIRSSLRLSFQTGDVAVEPMVFVQTSPDVVTIMEGLDRASKRFGRGTAQDFRIHYDNETIWQWYLRDYTNNSGSGGPTVGPLPEDVQAVFLLYENATSTTNQPYLDEFVSQRYPLRWWLPECDVYRFPASDKDCGFNANGSSLLSRILSKPLDGPTIADWWQFAIYRKVPSGLGSSDWVLFVRPAIADAFGLGSLPKP